MPGEVPLFDAVFVDLESCVILGSDLEVISEFVQRFHLHINLENGLHQTVSKALNPDDISVPEIRVLTHLRRGVHDYQKLMGFVVVL